MPVVARIQIRDREVRLKVSMQGFVQWCEKVGASTRRQIRHLGTLFGLQICQEWMEYFEAYPFRWKHVRKDRGKHGGPVSRSLRFRQTRTHQVVFYVPYQVCPYFNAIDQGARRHPIFGRKWRPTPKHPPMLYVPPERTDYPMAAGFHKAVTHPGVRPMHLVAKFNAHLHRVIRRILRVARQKYLSYLKRRIPSLR